MNRVLLYAFALLCTFSSHAQTAPKREMRGAWIATFSGIDWPNRTQTPAQQRTALITILDHHKATGINTLYIQVRSQCDAMYPSAIEPWSADLTGTQGKAPNPLWDPMQFAIDECHKRGIEFHAWINPYRAVATASTLSGFAATHVAKQHPEWLLNNGSTITLDPGIAAVRNYILSVITDILKRYDVDGIHFDDYFYPPAPFNDDATYNADKRGFPNSTTGRADWRRDNINLLIKRVYDSVLTIKPWVKFGVSPSGIYRSSTNPAIGSNTSSGASQHYTAVYADSKKWLQEGWVDYIEPQVYWYQGQTGSDYSILIPWWNDNSFGRHIYIGMAGYKVLNTTGWGSRSEIPNQVRLNRSKANIYGQAIYNTNSLRTNSLNFRDSLMTRFYNVPALQPTMPWRDATPPAAPSGLVATRFGNDSTILSWNLSPAASNELDKAKRYVVYRSATSTIDLNNPANILTLTVGEATSYTDKALAAGVTYYYTVTALDRFQNESASSNVTDYAPPSIICPGGDTLVADASCSATLPDYTGSAVVSDDVTPAGSIQVTQSPAAGTVLTGEGATTITLTATDASGKTASCSFKVVVADRSAPVIHSDLEMGSTRTVSTDAGTCSYTANESLSISATDNCSSTLTYSYTLTYNGSTSQPVSANNLSGAVFQKGATQVDWKVTDAFGNSTTYSYSINVADTEAPVLTCPATLTVSTDTGLCAATVSMATPPAADNCGEVTVSGVRSDNQPLTAVYPKGSTTITWTATDAAGNASSCTQTIKVEDTEAPVITNAAANPSSLFPPNHKMKNVTISYSVNDNCGWTVTSLSVSSNEPENGTGDGDTDNDWEIIDNHHVKLRAERAGWGNGRIYTITLKAVDAAGNSSEKAVTVTVPHDHSDLITSNRMIGKETVNIDNRFKVTASPNPGTTQFLLRFTSISNEPLRLKITDAAGRIIEAKRSIPANSSLSIGSRYRPGVYYAEIEQDGEKQVLKLVKQNR
ncbi:MAG: C-terminal target protein [Flaviaesturariibacter sp.]|nr:C-terminal target protein [Flaviaesturariibacter sp.]